MQDKQFDSIIEKKSDLEHLIEEIFQKNESYSLSLYLFIKSRLAQFRLDTYIEVEDILTEAYIRSRVSIKSGTTIKNPKGWLRAVCFNIIREKSREKRKSLSFSELSIDEDSICDNNSLKEDNLDSEKYAFLIESLKQLNPEEAEIIKLRFLEQLSWKEISEYLNSGKDKKHLSEAALRQRGSRALMRLRKAYT